MLFRVLLDCRSSAATASQPFITVKFVEAETECEAIPLAVARTKALMREKDFENAEIASFAFVATEIEPFDPDEAEFEAERSLMYYSDS